MDRSLCPIGRGLAGFIAALNCLQRRPTLRFVIQRKHQRAGLAVREIALRTGLSRNTVKKHLASNVVEPTHPKLEQASQLDDYKQTLTDWLFREASRSTVFGDTKMTTALSGLVNFKCNSTNAHNFHFWNPAKK